MDSAILLLLLVPLLLIAFRGSKQRKKVTQMQSDLGPGSEVMTASGQFGTVVAVEGDRVELEVAPGVSTWWLRQAIARQVDPVAADDELDEELDEELEDDGYEGDDVLEEDDPRREGLVDGSGAEEPRRTTLEERPLRDGRTNDDDADERPDGGTRRSA